MRSSPLCCPHSPNREKVIFVLTQKLRSEEGCRVQEFVVEEPCPCNVDAIDVRIRSLVTKQPSHKIQLLLRGFRSRQVHHSDSRLGLELTQIHSDNRLRGDRSCDHSGSIKVMVTGSGLAPSHPKQMARSKEQSAVATALRVMRLASPFRKYILSATRNSTCVIHKGLPTPASWFARENRLG